MASIQGINTGQVHLEAVTSSSPPITLQTVQQAVDQVLAANPSTANPNGNPIPTVTTPVTTPIAPAGQTYELTTGVNNILGSSDDDLINGLIDDNVALSTLQTTDTINGGAGDDTISITHNVSVGAPTQNRDLDAGELPTLTDVEVVNLTSVGVIGVTNFDTRFAPQAEQFNSVGSTRQVFFTDITLGNQVFGATGLSAANADVLAQFIGGDTGTNDSITFNLGGNQRFDELRVTGSTTAAANGGAEHFILVTSGSESVFSRLDARDSGFNEYGLDRVDVSGDQDITTLSADGVELAANGVFESSNLDASADIKFNTTRGAVSLTGGAHDDRFLLDTIVAADVINLGGGTNTIGITANTQVAAGGLAGVTGADIFELGSFSSATQDVDNIGSFSTYKISSSSGKFADLASDSNVWIASDSTNSAGLELKADTSFEILNVTFNDGTTGQQSHNNFAIDSNGTGTVETLNLQFSSTGGVVFSSHAISARTINITGADDVTFAELEAVTVNFNATQATGNITVTSHDGAGVSTFIRTGSGKDTVNLKGIANDDATVDLGSNDDTVNVNSAQEHTVTLGAGSDTVNFNDLASANTGPEAISDLSEGLTITDFVSGTDKLHLNNNANLFDGTGFTAAGQLDASNYFETILPSTASSGIVVETASQGLVSEGDAYVVAVQIGTNVHLLYDDNGYSNVGLRDGGVSEFAILSNITLAGIAVTDFTVF